MPKLVQPTSRDLKDVAEAIRSFPRAWGSVDSRGEYTPLVLSDMLWVTIASDKVTLGELWIRAGISVGKQSSHSQMLSADEHAIYVQFYKLRTGIFRVAWFGEIYLTFDRLKLGVGVAKGKTQAAMWVAIRGFFAGRATLYDSTECALGVAP